MIAIAGRVWGTVLLTVVLTSTAAAQWTTVGPGAGRITGHIGFTPTCGGAALVSAEPQDGRFGGIYRRATSNWGTLFRFDSAPSVNVMGVAPSNADTIYYNDNIGKLYRSTDGGLNWTNLTELSGCIRPDSVYGDMVVHPSDPATIWVSAGQVTKSINSGCTLVSDSSGLPAGSTTGVIAVAPSNANVKYVFLRTSALVAKVYRTTNTLPGTWVDVSTGIASGAVGVDLAIDPGNVDNVLLVASQLYRSQIFGTSPEWSTVTLPGTGTISPTAAAFDPIDRSAYVAGTVAGSPAVWKSTDGGRTFSAISASGITDADIGELAIDPGGLKLYATTLQGNVFELSLGRSCSCP